MIAAKGAATCLSINWCMQCEKVAYEKHGGPEGIEAYRRGLLEIRQERRALKRVTDQEKASSFLIVVLLRESLFGVCLSVHIL